MEQNYFLIDGSALQAQIRHLWRVGAVRNKSKLRLIQFIEQLILETRGLHGGSYKRAIFYFPSGDEEAVERHLIMPNFGKRKAVRDVNIKFCGQKLKRSAEFDEWVETDVPAKWKSRFSKSEKGIDIEICCEAFKLASFGSVERIFLLTNDDDFVPFCRVIKDFGCNVSIVHLTDLIPPNASLLREADSYDAVPTESLHELFEGGDEPAAEPDAAEAAEASSLKPEAEASSLIVDDAVSPSKTEGSSHDEDADKTKGA